MKRKRLIEKEVREEGERKGKQVMGRKGDR